MKEVKEEAQTHSYASVAVNQSSVSAGGGVGGGVGDTASGGGGSGVGDTADGGGGAVPEVKGAPSSEEEVLSKAEVAKIKMKC